MGQKAPDIEAGEEKVCDPSYIRTSPNRIDRRTDRDASFSAPQFGSMKL